MMDDELKQACHLLLYWLSREIADGRSFANTETPESLVYAFARRMQAVGLREAAKIARDRATRVRGDGELRQVYFLRKDEAEWIASNLEEHATTREQNHGA